MILLTGGSGCLGKQARELLEDVWAPERAEMDLTDPRRVYELTRGKGPGVILHLAAWTDVDGCERDPVTAQRINWLSVRALASAAKERDALLVYISTDYVFDGAKRVYLEGDDPRPLNIYGLTKLWGEREALSVPRSYVIRTSWVFGPGGRNFLSRFLDRVAEGKRLFAIEDQFSRPTYAPDLARALLDFVQESLPYGVYHLAGTRDASYYEFAKRGLEIAGMGPEPVPVSTEDLDRPAPRPRWSCLENIAYKTFTGKELRPWEKALEDYVSWWKSSKGS